MLLLGWYVWIKGETDVETIAGEDVDLKCLGISTTDQKVTITWTQSYNRTLFKCSSRTIHCDTNTTIHTLGKNNTFISSTVTIRNVSLVHEDEYDIIMLSPSNRQTCKINLTVKSMYFSKLFNSKWFPIDK